MVTSKGACEQRERHSKFLSYLTGARYVHPWWGGRCQFVIKFLSHTCNGKSRGIGGTCLLVCSPSAWPSWLLYRRGRKSRRDLWITLYIYMNKAVRICGYFSTSKRGPRAKMFEKIWFMSTKFTSANWKLLIPFISLNNGFINMCSDRYCRNYFLNDWTNGVELELFLKFNCFWFSHTNPSYTWLVRSKASS
jgi:hypothetical protein